MPHKFTEAIFRAKLPLTEKIVFWVLSERANANGVAWPGQSRIAADAGCDYTTAAHALKRLQEKGLITHTGWHSSPNGPTKEFTLNLRRILALGEEPSVGATPTVSADSTVVGAPEKPINSQVRVGDTPVSQTGTEGGAGVSPDRLAVVARSSIAIADLAASLRSEKPEQQPKEQQPNTGDSVPTPVGDLLGPGPSGTDESANEEDSSFASPFSRAGDPARWLANHLWMYLSVRPEVEIPYSWETYWSLDFQDALDRGWKPEQLEDIIRASQHGAARKYYVRAKSICSYESLERLYKIAEALNKKGLLRDEVCPKCKAFFPDADLVVEHYWASHQLEVDPADAAEEEAMWLAEELVSEGYITEHPELRMFYPWGDEDDQAFSPWADEPEQLSEMLAKSLAGSCQSLVGFNEGGSSNPWQTFRN
jgi:hypothetical protein